MIPRGEVLLREVRAADYVRLSEFFAALAEADEVTRHFHPHPFTPRQARRISEPPVGSRDLYFLAVDDDQVIGYAMLRGWDEGYEVPSFGLCVLPARQGEGLGGRLLDYALQRARQRGSERVMLKVNNDNDPARRLYESRGFELERLDEDQFVGYKPLKGQEP